MPSPLNPVIMKDPTAYTHTFCNQKSEPVSHAALVGDKADKKKVHILTAESREHRAESREQSTESRKHVWATRQTRERNTELCVFVIRYGISLKTVSNLLFSIHFIDQISSSQVTRALISVFDKGGLLDLAKALDKHGRE